MFGSFRNVVTQAYQSVSDKSSSSSKSSSNRSNQSASNRSPATISKRVPNISKTLNIESGPTDVKVSKAFLYIEHHVDCKEKGSFWGNHAATISSGGVCLEFALEESELMKHADCPFILRGLVQPKNPLPKDYHYIFTHKGHLKDILPMLGNHGLVDLSASQEMYHGDGEKILKDLFEAK